MRLAEPNKLHRKSGFKQALSLYDLPPNATVRLISRSENEIYKIEGPSGGRWALRVQRPGYQSTGALASEIAWLVALRNDGVVATPIPIAGGNGEWVQRVGGGSASEARNVVLFAWEDGHQPTVSMDLRQCFKSLGAITAKMHAHSAAWQRPQGFERFTWDFEAALGESSRWGRWRDGLGMNATRLDLFGRTVDLIRDRLAGYGRGPDRFGLAHCDLRLANLLLHEGAVKVIDFDDCGFSWYMYDAATLMSFYEHLPGAPGLRGRDSNLRHAAPPAAGGLGRLSCGSRPCPFPGRRLHRSDSGPLLRLSPAFRLNRMRKQQGLKGTGFSPYVTGCK
jgi:Ser/Thr protein kinase RdoA (MazF antagonist)